MRSARNRSPRVSLALFDFDGTLTERELFGAFLAGAVEPRRLAWGRALLAPLVLGYRAGLLSGTLVRAAAVRVGLGGADLAQVTEAGQRFAEDVLPGALRPMAMQRLRWHQARGDTVVVVSGAFDLYLLHWCRAQSVDLICSSLDSRDGRLTGRYRGAQCVGEEKARRVRQRYRLDDYAEVYAYGDTPEDHQLLALASRRWYRGVELDPRP